MAKIITVDEILALNPHIKEEELEEAREALRNLRNGRIRIGGRNIAPTYHRRRIFVGEGDSMDSRTIQLGHLRR